MRKFGKLNDQIITYFRNPLRVDGKDIFTNDPELLLQYGWKEVIFTNPEEREGYYPVSHWEETDTQIIQTWTYEPIESEV